MEMIAEFQGIYRFLSNFYPSPIEYKGITYPTVEHFFQAMKTKDVHVRKLISAAETPAIAKKMGKTVDIREDWEDIKQNVMRLGLEKKFEIPELREKLIETGSTYLQEGNSWSDFTWGVCLKTGRGKNLLGKLLMETRSRIMEDCGFEDSII